MREGVIVPQPAPFHVGDFVTALTKVGNLRKEWTITVPAAKHGTTDAIYLVDPLVGASLADSPDLTGYTGAGLSGDIVNSTEFVVQNIPDSLAIFPNTFLRIEVNGGFMIL